MPSALVLKTHKLRHTDSDHTAPLAAERTTFFMIHFPGAVAHLPATHFYLGGGVSLGTQQKNTGIFMQINSQQTCHKIYFLNIQHLRYGLEGLYNLNGLYNYLK